MKQRSSAVVRLDPPEKPPIVVAKAAGWQLPAGLDDACSNAADLIGEAETPPTFVIDRLAEDGDLILIAGQEKLALKTWLALQLAVARIVGARWLGLDVAPAPERRVLMISTETRAKVVVRRLLALADGCGEDRQRIATSLEIIDAPVTILPLDEIERRRVAAHANAFRKAQGTFDDDRRKLLIRSTENLVNAEMGGLGTNVDLLGAIATPDTWSLIVVDTLRECLAGDENSSDDARRFIAGCRDLARTCGCPVAIVHHTSKAGPQGEARSARGSVQLTAGPDAIVSIDASGEYPTAHFLVRNHAGIDPVGYRLENDLRGASVETMPALAGSNGGIAEDDVLAVMREHADKALTESTIRTLLARAKNPKAAPNAKANQRASRKAIDALLARKAISACTIERRNGKEMAGFRLGSTGGTLPAIRVTEGSHADVGDADDV